MKSFRNRAAAGIAAAFLAMADKMLGGDSLIARRASQKGWNRDPKTWSAWRRKQQSVAAHKPALYLRPEYAQRALKRYDRATRALVRPGLSVLMSGASPRYPDHASLPTHIKRNLSVSVMNPGAA